MPQFRSLKHHRISEEILRQLKESILLGNFKAGEKLPSERELTEQFQVSRGAVREAIRVLEITGFVKTRQGPAGGAFVTELSFDNVGNAFLDLFLANRVSIPEMAYVRRMIEPEIALLAAKNITQEGKDLLIQAQNREFLPIRNDEERVAVYQQTHIVLAEICCNHFLEAISKSLLRLTREMVEAVSPDHGALHSPGEHQSVIEAVIAGNGHEAASEMSKHMEVFYDRLIKMEKAYREKTTQVE